MASNFPVMQAMQVAALQYQISVAGIGGAMNSMPAGQFNLINFGFEMPVDENGVIQFDYTGFDQDAHETQMRNLLNGICNAMAVNLGRTAADVQAALTINRIWTFYSPVLIGGGYPSVIVTDQMTYP